MAAEIVHDDDVAGFQGRDEDLLDVNSEALAVDRAIENPWGLDPVVAQRGQEGRGLPVAVRDLGGEPDAARRPSPQRRHVGLGPGLVDEDQALRLDPALILRPLRAPAGDVGTVAFAGDDAFFEAQLLGVDEVPHRPVIDLEATLGQFGHQPAQGEVFLLVRSSKPSTVLARDRLRLVPAHLARRNAARSLGSAEPRGSPC